MFGQNIDDMTSQEIADFVELNRTSNPEGLTQLSDVLALSNRFEQREIDVEEYTRILDEFIGRTEGDDVIAATALKPKTVYHGGPEPISPRNIRYQEGKAFHVGTRGAAEERAATERTYGGAKPTYTTGGRVSPQSTLGRIGEAPYVNEYTITPRKPYMPDGKVISESTVEGRNYIYNIHHFGPVPEKMFDEANPFIKRPESDDFYYEPEPIWASYVDLGGGRKWLSRDELLAQGYDSIPYENAVEEPGSLSYLILNPNILSNHTYVQKRVVMPEGGLKTQIEGFEPSVAELEPIPKEEILSGYIPEIRYQNIKDEDIGSLIQRQQQLDLPVLQTVDVPDYTSELTKNLRPDDARSLGEDSMGEAARRYAHSKNKDATLARLVKNIADVPVRDSVEDGGGEYIGISKESISKQIVNSARITYPDLTVPLDQPIIGKNLDNPSEINTHIYSIRKAETGQPHQYEIYHGVDAIRDRDVPTSPSVISPSIADITVKPVNDTTVRVTIKPTEDSNYWEIEDLQLTSGDEVLTKDEWVRLAETIMDDTGADTVQGMGIGSYYTNDPNQPIIQAWRGYRGKGFEIGKTAPPESITRADIEEWNKLYPKEVKRTPIIKRPESEPVVGQRRTAEDMERYVYTDEWVGDMQVSRMDITDESLLDELSSARKLFISETYTGSNLPSLSSKGLTFSTDPMHPEAKAGAGRILSPVSIGIRGDRTKIYRTLDSYNKDKEAILNKRIYSGFPRKYPPELVDKRIPDLETQVEHYSGELSKIKKITLNTKKGIKWHQLFTSNDPTLIRVRDNYLEPDLENNLRGLDRNITKKDITGYYEEKIADFNEDLKRFNDELNKKRVDDQASLFPISVVDELTEQNFDSIYIPASGDNPGWIHVFDDGKVTFPVDRGEVITPEAVRRMEFDSENFIRDAISSIDPEAAGIDKVQTTAPISTRITSLFSGVPGDQKRPDVYNVDVEDFRADLYSGGQSQQFDHYMKNPLTRHRDFTDEAAYQNQIVGIKRVSDLVEKLRDAIGGRIRPRQMMNHIENIASEEIEDLIRSTPVWLRAAEIIMDESFQGPFLDVIRSLGGKVPARPVRATGWYFNKWRSMKHAGNIDVLRASVVRHILRNEFVGELSLLRHSLDSEIKRVFGRKALHGGKFDTGGLQYIGHNYNPRSMIDETGDRLTQVQINDVIKNVDDELTFTLKDIFENPGDYRGLTREMKELIQAVEDWGLAGQELVNAWGVHVKRFNPNRGGAYLATFGKNADDIHTDIDYDFRPMAPKESHSRSYPTLRDRMLREYIPRLKNPKAKIFRAEYDISKILNYSLTYKSNQVGDQGFRRSVKGRNKQDLLRFAARGDADVRKILDDIKSAKKQVKYAGANLERVMEERQITWQEDVQDFIAFKHESATQIRAARDELETIIKRKNISSDDLKGKTKLMTEGRALDNNLDVVKADDFNTKLGLSNDDLVGIQRTHWRLGNIDDRLAGVYRHYTNPTTNMVELDDVVAAAEMAVRDAHVAYNKAINKYQQWQPRNIAGSNYEFVGYGVNKWFKSETAQEIRRIRKPAHKYFMGWVPTNPMLLWTQTVLSTDLSQLSYQLPIALAFRPRATIMAILRFLSPMEKGESSISALKPLNVRLKVPGADAINGLRRTTTDARAKQLMEDPEYAEYVRHSGAIQLRGTGEFSAGVLPQLVRKLPVPGSAASGDFLQGLNDWGFTVLDMVRFQQWKNSWRGYAKDFMTEPGMTRSKAEIMGKILASEVHDWTVPRISRGAVKRGMSEAEMASERVLWTSVSMVRKPIEMMGTAANGFAKVFINAMPAVAGRGQVMPISAKERAAMRMGVQLSMSVSSACVAMGTVEGYNKGLRGDRLQDFVMDKIDPRSSEFWTLYVPGVGNVRIGGPYRSLGRALASQKFEIGGFTPLGDTDIPLGGMFQFFEGRISPPLRALIDGFKRETWDGRAIDADNGLNSWVNIVAWAAGSVSPITFSRFPEAVSQEGARWEALPDIFKDGSFVVDAETTGTGEMSDVPLEILREWFGISYYERSPRSELNIAAMVWGDENDAEMQPDKEGNMSFYSLSERDRARMMADEEGGGKEIAEQMRKRVYQMAEGRVGTYHLQKELYELEDAYLDSLTELSESPLMAEGRLLGEAYGDFQDIRRKFYDERSRIFEEMDMDPEDEPLEGTRDHWMWSYRQLFDQALDKKGEFDHETFAVLLATLKDDWRTSGQGDAWEYVQDQQHLIEMKYPKKIKDMSEHIRKISDSGWWDIADPVNVKPAMIERYPSLSGYMNELNTFLDTDKVHWEDLTTGSSRKNQIYRSIEKMRSAVVGPSGKIGKQKEAFLLQNPDIGNLLDLYGFSAPGKQYRERNRQMQLLVAP